MAFLVLHLLFLLGTALTLAQGETKSILPYRGKGKDGNFYFVCTGDCYRVMTTDNAMSDTKLSGRPAFNYNDNCPDLSSNLGNGCSVSDDCTTITCKEKGIGDKDLSLTIKINKCEEPVTIDITVEALGFYWKKTFESSDKIAIPGLSFKPAGKFFSAGVYLQVNLKDTGSNLQLKIIILTGFEVAGSFKELTSSTIADSRLPISTYECGIVRWWNSLSDLFKALVVGGGIVFIVLIGICCCCCCCRRNKAGGAVIVAPPPPVAVTSTKTTVPMRPFVNEI